MSSKSDKKSEKSDVCPRCKAEGFDLIDSNPENEYAQKLGKHCSKCGLYEGVKGS